MELNLTINGENRIFFGLGVTKKFARRDAAKNAYTFLKDNNLLTKEIVIDVLDGVDEANAYAALKELETKKQIISAHLEELEQKKNESGNAIWPIKVEAIDNNKNVHSSIGETTSKSKSKNKAAFEVLKQIGKITLAIGVGIGTAIVTSGKVKLKK